MMWSFARACLIIVAAVAPVAAQQRVGPIYPENSTPGVQPPAQNLRSGQDPFQLNPFTGRFEYVPIPYEFQPGTNGSPAYGFNWHSGRWDYVPTAPLNTPLVTPLSTDLGSTREVTQGNYLDRRIDPTAGVGIEANAQTAVATLPPTDVAPAAITQGPPAQPTPARPRATALPLARPPTTAPSTAPAKPGTPGAPPAMRVRLTGRWEFDYATGRWVFILPSDD
jgi:hypothetical protein